jgi:phosphoserine phosphatase RsbU/P
MVRFAVWIVAYGAVLWLVDRFSGGAPRFLWFLFWVTFIPVVAYYIFRLVAYLRRYVLWHLRRRLILTYFFVGVVPIGLILLLVLIAALILNGQFASFLVVSKLNDRVDELEQLAQLVARHAERSPATSPEAVLDEADAFLVAEVGEQSTVYPALEATFRMRSLERAYRLQGKAPVQPVSNPSWLKGDQFDGIVVDKDRLALRVVNRTSTPAGDLVVILSQPFTSELLDQVGQGIGPVSVFGPPPGTQAPVGGSGSGPNPARSEGQTPPAQAPQALQITNSAGQVLTAGATTSKSIQVPRAASFLDYTVYNLASLQPYVWESPVEQRETEAGLFYVTSRIVALNRQLLSTLGQLSGVYWTVFAVVGIVFLAIELVAVIISWRLTRSITTTVDKLNLATERVKAGDFSYRVNLPARDQLTALGEAFDGMTASVERLLRESLEKTRLEGELEIAREVQSRLFPQSVPELPGLRLYGLCKPARVVSGDYYDFVSLGEGRAAVVLGDISGKGISAALLMATLQSALHAQFYDSSPSPGAPQAWFTRTADVVARLNRQIYLSTPREKYVTLFYGVYDGASRRLTYTNAGHLPPVLFRQDRVERLEGGGTVVGLFPSATYEQAEICFEPGDLLLAFSDGITEPENGFGEEFGEARLLQVARHARSAPPETMVDEIYRTVSDWTGSPELQDDMTLVVAQAVS